MGFPGFFLKKRYRRERHPGKGWGWTSRKTRLPGRPGRRRRNGPGPALPRSGEGPGISRSIRADATPAKALSPGPGPAPLCPWAGRLCPRVPPASAGSQSWLQHPCRLSAPGKAVFLLDLSGAGGNGPEVADNDDSSLKSSRVLVVPTAGRLTCQPQLLHTSDRA